PTTVRSSGSLHRPSGFGTSAGWLNARTTLRRPQRIGSCAPRLGALPSLSARCGRVVMAAEMFMLDERVAIVTGSGTGIGRATAQVLAQHGADVVLAARRVE